MWFGVLFAVLLELVSGSIQSTGLAVFLFVMNNVGGNLPVVVDPLSNIFSYHTALLIMYPGGYLLSKCHFLVFCLDGPMCYLLCTSKLCQETIEVRVSNMGFCVIASLGGISK